MEAWNDSESDHESHWEDHIVKLRRREVALEAVVEEQARRIQELEAALAAQQSPEAELEAQERRIRELEEATENALRS